MKGENITARQLAVTVFISLLSPFIRILPRSAVNIAQNAAWLSVIPATVAGFIYLRAISGRTAKSLSSRIKYALGNFGGKIFLSIIFLWLLFYGGFVARSAAERLVSTVYQRGGVSVFLWVMAAASALAGGGSLKGLVRTGEVFSVIIGVLLIIVIFASVMNVELENLLPVKVEDTGKILLGSLPILDVIGAGLYFLFLGGSVRSRDNLGKEIGKKFLSTMAAIFGVMVVTVGFCHYSLIPNFQNGFFTVIRNITIFGVVERIEALIIATWILTDFMLLSSVIMICRKILGSIFRSGESPVLAAAFGAVTAAVGSLFPNAFVLESFSDLYVPVINMTLTYILIPAVMVAGWIKGQVKGEKYE